MKPTILKIWQNPEYYSDTKILNDEYSVLDSAKLLITKAQIDQNRGQSKVHPVLPPEPFVGNLNEAKYFIINLNPRAGIPYSAEYKNWETEQLKTAWENNLTQKEYQYPFYYLNPKLNNTEGAKWWTKRLLPSTIYFKFDGKKYKTDDAKNLLAKQLCDIELFPYHSRYWSPEITDLIAAKKLPSCTAAIEFIKTIIADPTKIIFIHKTKKDHIKNTLLKFIPEIKNAKAKICYINCQQTIYLTPTSESGKILYADLVKNIKPII